MRFVSVFVPVNQAFELNCFQGSEHAGGPGAVPSPDLRPASGGGLHQGQFCSPPGSTAFSSTGEPMVCSPAPAVGTVGLPNNSNPPGVEVPCARTRPDGRRESVTAGVQPILPGVPAGTCTPSQLHGVQVRHAINAHCCSGVNGPGPAHGGVPGVPHIGSAEAVGTPVKVPPPITNAMAARNAVMRSRVRFMTISNLVDDGQIVSPRPDTHRRFAPLAVPLPSCSFALLGSALRAARPAQNTNIP
jgi:hypothetical protein